jgi:hypothetical protein
MFLRTVQAAQGHTYLRLVENFRQGGLASATPPARWVISWTIY